MTELFSVTVRSNTAASRTGCLAALAIVCGVALGVDLFIGRKHSPMAFLDIYFFFGGILLTGIAVWMSIKAKRTLTIHQYPDKSIRLSIASNGVEEFVLDKPVKLQALFINEYMGKGARKKELYLRIFDTPESVGLTLKHTIGSLSDQPLGFQHVRMSEVKASNIYTCSQTAAIHQELIKWIHKEW